MASGEQSKKSIWRNAITLGKYIIAQRLLHHHMNPYRDMRKKNPFIPEGGEIERKKIADNKKMLLNLRHFLSVLFIMIIWCYYV